MQKIALITGATNGIGLITTIEVAKAGFKTIIVGRNKNKTIETVDIIKNKSGNVDIDYLIADLSIMDECKKLAEDF